MNIVFTPHKVGRLFDFGRVATLAIAGASLSFSTQAANVGLVPLGDLTDYLLVFTQGEVDLNLQSASKGYVGDVAVDGVQADERTSGTVPYAGTMYTSDSTLSAWQGIIDDNPTQATAVYNETARIAGLEADFDNALSTGNALAATGGYDGINSSSLDGLNTQNGTAEFFVIDVTGELSVSQAINITGDANDFFLLRWDENNDTSDGFQGQVKFQSGGGINPLGDLGANNFVNFAGDINASGGGSNLSGLQDNLDEIAAIDGGSAVNGGGFFTGYWLTTGEPPAPGESSSLSNAIFVGGLYTQATKISLTSGTSGVYVAPIPLPAAAWLFGSALLGIVGVAKRKSS